VGPEVVVDDSGQTVERIENADVAPPADGDVVGRLVRAHLGQERHADVRPGQAAAACAGTTDDHPVAEPTLLHEPFQGTGHAGRVEAPTAVSACQRHQRDTGFARTDGDDQSHGLGEDRPWLRSARWAAALTGSSIGACQRA